MRSEPRLILAFDTSAALCAAGLFLDGRTLASRGEAMERGQAERLMPMLEEVLAEAGRGWRDLDALAVCTGPGNFTGTRIAVAAARGLALALGIPAVGVTPFEALAATIAGPAIVGVPDRRRGAAWQAFIDGAALAAPVFDPAELPSMPSGTRCLGAQAAVLAGRIGLAADRQGPEAAGPREIALAAARRAGDAPPPAPFYLHPPDARPTSEPAPVLLDDA